MKLEQEKLAVERERLSNKTSEEKADKEILKIPPFKEETDKFDAYISRFESVAKLNKWKEEDWPIQLSLVLTGEALDIVYSLSDQDQKDYKESAWRHGRCWVLCG